MRFSNSKEICKLVEGVLAQGWTFVEPGGSKHAKLISPEGRKLIVPGSPGDRRASLNFRTSLRHMGASI